MKHIKVGVSMHLQGCKIEDVIEVEDDATQDDIDAEVREWALQYVEWWGSPKDAE